MLKNIFLSLLFIFAFISCKSGDSFLLESLNDSEKSDILTNKGIERYQKDLIENEDTTRIESVKVYFVRALEYNPANQTATQYIKRVDSFKDLLVKRLLNAALRYKNIGKNKSELDEFNMCYFIQSALNLDPRSKEAEKMKNEAKDSFKKIIDIFMQRGDKTKEAHSKEKNETVLKRMEFDAIYFYNRVLLLDPDNVKAKSEKSNFESFILSDMRKLADEASKFLNAKNYIEARNKIYLLKDYGNKLGDKMKDEISKLDYNLNYNWANYLYSINNLDLASAKIWLALEANKSQEAYNLNRVIQEKRSKVILAQSFDSIVENIDQLINANELSNAKRSIDNIYKSLANQKQKDTLDSKISVINSKIAPLYNEAIQNYNEENFKDAIKKFKTILEIDENYKDAKQYYNKAIEKQKTIESY